MPMIAVASRIAGSHGTLRMPRTGQAVYRVDFESTQSDVYTAIAEGAGRRQRDFQHLDSADYFTEEGFHFLHKNNQTGLPKKFQDPHFTASQCSFS